MKYLSPHWMYVCKIEKSVLHNKDIHTVVRPDLCVICNPDLLNKRDCNGANGGSIGLLTYYPKAIQKKSGVIDYWLVYPKQQAIHQFILNEICLLTKPPVHIYFLS